MSRRRSFFESSNPVMTEKAFQQSAGTLAQGGETMTVNGAVNKTLILTGILLLTTVFSYANPNPILMWGGAIGGFIVVIFSVFKPQYSQITAPIYAALEGLFVGGISAAYASVFNGIIFQAVSITMAILFMMLFLYKSGIIKVTKSFRTGVIMATGAVALVYIISMVLRMFGIQIPFLHSGGMIGIGISLVIIGIASLNLLLDFDNFEKGEQYGAPTYMEWFSAMGLLITLIWLYLEVLRLVAMLSGRD
jgi:uncharacterized YccA/Bax inhibitor family protein